MCFINLFFTLGEGGGGIDEGINKNFILFLIILMGKIN